MFLIHIVEGAIWINVQFFCLHTERSWGSRLYSKAFRIGAKKVHFFHVSYGPLYFVAISASFFNLYFDANRIFKIDIVRGSKQTFILSYLYYLSKYIWSLESSFLLILQLKLHHSFSFTFKTLFTFVRYFFSKNNFEVHREAVREILIEITVKSSWF